MIVKIRMGEPHLWECLIVIFECFDVGVDCSPMLMFFAWLLTLADDLSAESINFLAVGY